MAARYSFIKSTSRRATGWGSLARTASCHSKKSLDTRKAGEDVPKVSALDDTLTHTHFIYSHTLKHKWPKLQKSEVQMSRSSVASSSTLSLRRKLPFLRSRSPSHRRRSPCSRPSPYLLLSLNPSLQISGTCWHRCVYPSHAAP